MYIAMVLLSTLLARCALVWQESYHEDSTL